jgi:TusA-related sulfurtransferase
VAEAIRKPVDLDAVTRANLSGDAAELASLKPDAVLDVRGEVCPYPVTAALKALARLRPGQVLVEVTDHTISTHTVPRAVTRERAAEVLGVLQDGPGLYRIYLRRV